MVPEACRTSPQSIHFVRSQFQNLLRLTTYGLHSALSHVEVSNFGFTILKSRSTHRTLTAYAQRTAVVFDVKMDFAGGPGSSNLKLERVGKKIV